MAPPEPVDAEELAETLDALDAAVVLALLSGVGSLELQRKAPGSCHGSSHVVSASQTS